ncbi:response regulator [Ramlibacter sp. WS9]|uniref:response regulator n=1 Tax=Ramlibacter sp. WS9 TaxID=1882741 RepID=UPI0013052D47|nr:response regulator [Ramlibacter sp. WS9]
MKELIRSLYERYCAHHDMERPFLEWIGIVGFAAFPLFYLLRQTSALPPLYDDLALRIAASLMCLLLAVRRWWPDRAKRFYIGYSYLAVFYCLSFLLSFTMLKNHGGTPSVVNMVMGAILIVLLADWRNTVAMLLSGYVLSVLVFWATDSDPRIPPEFVISAAGSILVVVVGALSHYGQKRAELERLRLLYAGLAGSVAHEMRSPLMQIRHVLDAVAADLPAAYRAGGSISFTHQQVGDMLRAVGQGQDAVTRGLQAITVTLQQLNPNAFDAASFRYLSAGQYVKQAVNEFAYEDYTHRARVAVSELNDFSFRGDETAFTLILFNLIKNALYYLPTHPHLTVTVAVDSGRPNRVVVRDTGPGIPADQVAGLFGEFRSTGKAEGTGLGLAFCRRAMRAIGGDIACRSEPGEFTEFILSFPTVPQAQIEADEQEALRRAAHVLAGKRVLVVDDEELVRQSISSRLAALGCQVDAAADGREALEAMRHWPYELVLMDLHMPVSNGFDATRQIRRGAVPGCEHTPIVGFSGSPTSAVGTRARQVGMNGFVGKDCSTVELAQAMAQALEGAAPQPGEPATTALVGKTVLLVEDNAFNRAIVKARLVEWGMQVVEAEHGYKALHLLEAGTRPAVILMDVEMPGLDGLAATRVLRSTMPDSVKNTPVLALTGHSSPERRDAARAAGMNGFLTKPLDPSALRRELIHVLGGNRIAAGGATAPAATALTTVLNTRRINEFQRMGILHELLPGCLGEIRRFVARLEECLGSKDRNGVHDALHSLLGMSGEAGAQALHQAVERVYGTISEGEWPRETDWLAQIRRLVDLTEAAMLDHYAVRCEPASS